MTAANPDIEYYFIMGADSLLSFESWREPQEICRLCVLVAAVRDHMPQTLLNEQIDRLREKFHADIRKLESLNIDISSRTIRSWAAEGRSCRYYVPEPVIAYMEERGIYRGNSGGEA